MAVFYAKDYSVTLNGTALTSFLTAVELPLEADVQETTTFGQNYRTRAAGGLQDATLTLSFNQDFGASAVDATLYPLFNTVGTVVIKPTSGTVSSTNPSYTGTFVISEYSPFASSIGDIATLDVTWPSAGSVVRATT